MSKDSTMLYWNMSFVHVLNVFLLSMIDILLFRLNPDKMCQCRSPSEADVKQHILSPGVGFINHSVRAVRTARPLHFITLCFIPARFVCVCVWPIIRPFNIISGSVEFHSDWRCEPVSAAEGLVTHPARTWRLSSDLRSVSLALGRVRHVLSSSRSLWVGNTKGKAVCVLKQSVHSYKHTLRTFRRLIHHKQTQWKILNPIYKLIFSNKMNKIKQNKHRKVEKNTFNK